MTDSIARRRLLAQRLVGAPSPTATQVVGDLLAVQAQDYAGAKWAIGQRTSGATDHDLDALLDEGTLVRTHVLRPTWHLVLAADIRWLLALTGPRVRATTASYFRRLELDDAVIAASRDLLIRELEGGRSLTRREIAHAYALAGLELDTMRRNFLLLDAELAGLICNGPRRGRQHTFALLDERVPGSRERTRDEALAEIARRFVEGHGPAQALDLSWWSGLTMAEARLGLHLAGDVLATEHVGERTLWASASAAPPAGHAAADGAVRLLPNYDELLVAFKDRSDARHPGLPPGTSTSPCSLTSWSARGSSSVAGGSPTIVTLRSRPSICSCR